MQAGDCLQILREIKDVSFASVDEQGIRRSESLMLCLPEVISCISQIPEGRIFHRQIFSIRKSRLPE